MDLKITGKFIQECRKAKGLTQAELAEKISVSEKTVSKWECGKGFPDTSLMLPLCEALDISVGELLSGKRLGDDEYKSSAEKNLVELKSKQQILAKQWLTTAIALLIVAILFVVACGCIAEFVPMALGWQILLMVVSIVVVFGATLLVLWTEKGIGFYVCGKCGHRHIPSYGKILISMHMGYDRYMKCPKCGKWSWNKKHWTED